MPTRTDEQSCSSVAATPSQTSESHPMSNCYSGGLPAPLRQAEAGRHTLLLPAPAALPFVSKSRFASTGAHRHEFVSPSRRRPPPPPPRPLYRTGVGTRVISSCFGLVASPAIVNVDGHTESEVAMGYTITQICDKFIEFFMHEKPQTKEWRKILVFREEWRRYRPHFYKYCQVRIDMEIDSAMKQKLVVLARKVKKIDDEIEKHMELFTELRENPADINSIVARRRKDFTGEFFRHLNFLLNAYNGLDERDAIVRLGAKCLSAIHAYDCTLEQLDINSAQSKFDDILNSSSLDDACDKLKSLAKAKELDSSLILLINRAWAAAKDSKTMKNEVKDIMYHIYTTTKESLKSISPPEMKLLKYLLNIEDPEERFGALATAFSPGDEHEVKDEDALYTTPNELHKWIKIMLDSYHLNKEEMDFMDARKMSDPVIIQRLILLKETIQEEYMKQYIHPEEQDSEDQESEESEESEE